MTKQGETVGGFGIADQQTQAQSYLNRLAEEIHIIDNYQWWHDLVTGERLKREPSTLYMLMVSEMAEAFEGLRKNMMDKHLPHRKAEEVEFADAFIRMLDYCGAMKFDIDGAIAEKRAYNAVRADHKKEHRLADGGKKF